MQGGRGRCLAVSAGELKAGLSPCCPQSPAGTAGASCRAHNTEPKLAWRSRQAAADKMKALLFASPLGSEQTS